jgi:ERCC4-type nuclease
VRPLRPRRRPKGGDIVTHFERKAGGPRTAISPMVVCVDSREQTPPPMPEGIVLERWTLETGDYSTPMLQAMIAVVERKSVSDFASSITRDRERFDDELRRLGAFRWRAIVVEGDLSEVYRASAAHPHSILGSCASFFARSDCPVLFAANPHGAGRLICGILRRWEERVTTEGAAVT